MPDIIIHTDARTEKAVKDLYSSYGLTVSEAVNLFFKVTLKEKKIPYKLWKKQYNASVLKALKEVEEIEKNNFLTKAIKQWKSFVKVFWKIKKTQEPTVSFSNNLIICLIKNSA